MSKNFKKEKIIFMKLLVSDYDDTIFVDRLFGCPHIPEGTIPLIEDFMSKGNKFMIATARPYESIMNEIKNNHIPYDYVSSLNGCIIHNNTGDIIYSKESIKLNIEEFYKLYSCIDKIEVIKDKDKVLYYAFKTKLFTCSNKLICNLEKLDFEVQSWFMNTYNIARPVSNKIDSVLFIQDILGLSDDGVITIGDSNDDLEMIRKYYSYGIVKSVPNVDILKCCDKKVKSLKGAFKYINKNI